MRRRKRDERGGEMGERVRVGIEQLTSGGRVQTGDAISSGLWRAGKGVLTATVDDMSGLGLGGEGAGFCCLGHDLFET